MQSVDEVVQAWRCVVAFAVGSCVAWAAETHLAMAMASGQWFGDVSVRHQRTVSPPGPATTPPVAPSIGLMRHFATQARGSIPAKPLEEPPTDDDTVWDDPRGFVRRFHPTHVIANARAGLGLGSQANLGEQLTNSLRWWYPKTWRQKRVSLVRERRIPHAAAVRRACVRLDIASMLAWRAWYKARGPAYRYLSFDASPQRGQEYFVTVERLVLCSTMDQLASGDMPNVLQRLMPLCVLGSGRMGLAEKVQTHVHQVWLEYGPSVQDVRSANRNVRQCLSDMGHELDIADARDVVASCLGQRGPPGQDLGLLYPLALVVPGPQHIIDLAVRHGLEALPWWPAWQQSAKVVCQWVRTASHRQLLQHRLRDVGGDPEVVRQRVKALDTSCESFARWRWKTLRRVVQSLARIQDSTCAALASMRSATELNARDGGLAEEFLRAVQDAKFWERNAGLALFVEPLASMSAWVRGCDCHEEDRLARKEVSCQWQGCRAKRLASRCWTTLDDMSAARNQLHASPDIANCVDRAMASFQLNMSWVHEAPYDIWQADDPAVAASMLVNRAETIAAGGQPHRVVEHFCGEHEGSLRADMERHAAGLGMSGQLAAEIRSYQLAKIDDTWAASAHRDVSTYGQRVPAGKVPRVAATQRLRQTLALVDSLSASELRHCHRCLRSYKAISQPSAKRANALHGVRNAKPNHVRGQVYRCDESAMRDWGAELDGAIKAIDASQTRRLHMAGRLQVGHVHGVIVEGTVLSVPPVGGAAASRAPVGDASASVCEGACDTFVHRGRHVGSSQEAIVRTFATGTRCDAFSGQLAMDGQVARCQRSAIALPRRCPPDLGFVRCRNVASSPLSIATVGDGAVRCPRVRCNRGRSVGQPDVGLA